LAERHRRPLPDLRIGPFALELADGFQVPPAGTHGTPIRMIDWRDTLNWMLAVAR